MRPLEQAGGCDHETEEVRWVSIDDARRLLSETSTIKGRDRDLAALAAAIEVRQRETNRKR